VTTEPLTDFIVFRVRKETPVMSDPPSTRTPSARATVKRKPQRAAYDRATIDEILDQGLICHVGFSDGGQTFVLPTIHVRVGDQVYLHGSPASRLLQILAAGTDMCLAVTLLDGLALARSAMHHSMNYRSVVLFGTAQVVDDESEKLAVLHALTEHIIPGRWADVRMPSDHELRQTMVVAIPIHEASAKIRTGPPLDEEADYELPIWAGVVPLRIAAGAPVPDSGLSPEIKSPPYATKYPGPR
jgi:nitroimidazol reductase NimA-like FMN-containing flavoprotein (pyridoxamine 5'-phosphate oxidase superfamily)